MKINDHQQPDDCVSGTVVRGAWSSSAALPLDRYTWEAHADVRARAESITDSLALKGLPSSSLSLGDQSVLVAGLGAVGGPALVELARAGVGRLEGIDPDHYGAESFTTQPITELAAHLGQPKAWVQGARAHAANPSVTVRCTAAHVQDLPLRVLVDTDPWLAVGDNPEMVVWLGERAAALGKTLLQGAVHPESSTAIVRAWDLRQPSGPCPACGMSERAMASLGGRRGCDPQAAPGRAPLSTRTLSPICVTAGQLLAFEAIKQLSGNEQLALSSEELNYSLWTHRALRTKLMRNRKCRAPHQPWSVTDARDTWDRVTPEMLLRELGVASDARAAVRGEMSWVTAALCDACERQHAVRQFGHVASRFGHCDCGGVLSVPPAGLRSVIPYADLMTCRDQSLAGLGLPPDRGVGVLVGETWHYFLPPRAAFDDRLGPCPQEMREVMS